MTDILDSIDNEATKTHQKLLILRWVEYAICFLNGLAAFAFLMNCIFDADSLGIYFFAGSGLILFISQFQLLYIYFWRKSFQKHQHTTHSFKAYSWTVRWSRNLLLIWGVLLMVAAISIFVSYRLYSLTYEAERGSFYYTMFTISLDFFVLSVLYLYYNMQIKRLSNTKLPSL